MKVFDLGTGTGILSIAAAKLGASSILALDTDPVAVQNAKTNCQSNSSADIVDVKRGTLSLKRQKELTGSFDMVLANIYAQVISNLAAGLYRVMKRGGIFVGSGIHSNQVDEVLIKLAVTGFSLISLDDEEGWAVILAQKPE